MTVVAPTFYFRLPAWCQDLAVTLVGARHRWRRTDPREQASFLGFIAESERWTADRIHQWQTAELRTHLALSCQTIPYWRDLQSRLGFEPGDFDSVASLSRLPVLEKTTLKVQPRSFRPDDGNTGPVVCLNTSGTTGTPLGVYYSRRGFARKWACVARLRQWHGVSRPLLPRRVQITGSPLFDVGREARRPWRHNLAARTLMVPVNGINSGHVPRLLTGLKQWGGIEVMDGYPSAMAHLARLGQELGIPGPTVPVLITTAETLRPDDRALITAYFGGRVVDQYSACEPSVFVGECEAGSRHLFPQSGILELEPLAGEDSRREHVARIIMTPFHNSAQVLIRYAIGDLARVTPGRSCSCGRQTLVLDGIEGRTSDMVTVETPAGRRALTSALLSNGFHGFDAVRRGQIVQLGPNTIAIRYELKAPLGEGGEEALSASFKRTCGDGVRIVLEPVASFDLGPNGKFRAVIPLPLEEPRT